MVQAGQTREQIQESLIAKAEGYFADFDTHNTVVEDAAKNYIAKQTINESGVAVTLAKWDAMGVTKETMQRFIDNPFELAPIMNNKMSFEMLPDVEGRKCAHIKAKGPMLVSTRTVISVLYKVEREGGEQLVFHSS